MSGALQYYLVCDMMQLCLAINTGVSGVVIQ